MSARVVIASASDGDWEGVYVDGKLVAEDHSLFHGPYLDDVLAALGLAASEGREIAGAALEWLHGGGGLPTTLAELDAKLAELTP